MSVTEKLSYSCNARDALFITVSYRNQYFGTDKKSGCKSVNHSVLSNIASIASVIPVSSFPRFFKLYTVFIFACASMYKV